MIKNKSELRSIIYKYTTENIGTNALGFIEYHTFDTKLIKRDMAEINKFFRDNFNLNKNVIHYRDLLKDERGRNCIEISSILDIELLDELIAFGIAANVFTENLMYRYRESLGSPILLPLLNENPEDLKNYTEQKYINAIKFYVLPHFCLDVSEYTLSQYENYDGYSIERKKELLLSWWDEGMEGLEDPYMTRELFMAYLESEMLEDLIPFISNLYSQNKTSASLSTMIKNGDLVMRLMILKLSTSSAPKELKDQFNAEIKHMFDELNNRDQKKKRLN